MSSEPLIQPNVDLTAEVIDFNAYNNRDTIAVLEATLADARAGRITGVIMVAQRTEREANGAVNNGVAVAGSYERDPRRVCGIAGEIFVYFMPQTLGRPKIIPRA
jgi:hypothetical protein